MIIEGRPDLEKAVEVLLYVTHKAPQMYNALKVIYFADKSHLQRYGRLIYGDSYVAMNYGPVPSAAYDLVKKARGAAWSQVAISVSEVLSVADGYLITPRREPNFDLLSESDIECLDEAIECYGDMQFGELRNISHDDPAFQSADRNAFMSLRSIAASLSDNEFLDYVENG